MTAPAPQPAVVPTTRLRLYEATEQLEIVRTWLDESEGELTPEIEALLNDATEAFDQKAERVALMVREFETTALALDAEIDRLKARHAAVTHAATSLRTYLVREMERAGRTRIERPLAVLAIITNSTPSVDAPPLTEEQLRDLAQHMPAFVKIVPEQFSLDKRAIAEAWKRDPDAELPDGVTVFRGQHLRIR